MNFQSKCRIIVKQSIFIVHPQTPEQTTALKAFMQAQKINFEVSREEAYNPEFVEKIIKSKKQIARGEFTDAKLEDIPNFIDS